MDQPKPPRNRKIPATWPRGTYHVCVVMQTTTDIPPSLPTRPLSHFKFPIFTLNAQGVKGIRTTSGIARDSVAYRTLVVYQGFIGLK